MTTPTARDQKLSSCHCSDEKEPNESAVQRADYRKVVPARSTPAVPDDGRALDCVGIVDGKS